MRAPQPVQGLRTFGCADWFILDECRTIDVLKLGALGTPCSHRYCHRADASFSKSRALHTLIALIELSLETDIRARNVSYQRANARNAAHRHSNTHQVLVYRSQKWDASTLRIVVRESLAAAICLLDDFVARCRAAGVTESAADARYASAYYDKSLWLYISKQICHFYSTELKWFVEHATLSIAKIVYTLYPIAVRL